MAGLVGGDVNSSAGTLKWRLISIKPPLVAMRDLVPLVAEAIDTGLDSHFLTVEVIGAGRQPQAASNLVDVVQEFVDQGAKPRTLLTLLRCLLVRCLLVRRLLVLDHRASPTAMFTPALSHATW
jgi:hypothetical protein